jgi:2,3-bisphosphoglycerate-dependent phosphoglycerate mutase
MTSPGDLQDSPLELLVIRHGQSEWNALGRGHGWGDPPLSPLGEAQAAAAVPALARQRLGGGVVASDLRRARRTAELVAEPLGLGPVTTAPDLREHDIGDWDGHTWDEIEVDWPGAKAAWVAEEIDQPPGGESRDAFHGRVWRGVTGIAGTRPGGRLLVVAHGGVVRALERMAGVEPHPIAFLSGRWFSLADGRLHAGEPFMAEEPTGRDFEPTSRG